MVLRNVFLFALLAARLLIKILPVIAGCGVIGILLAALCLAWLQYHSHQLWDKVSQYCVPEQLQQGKSVHCLAVNLGQRYAVFNDAHGPLHTLLIPTEKTSGIESPALREPTAKNYFQYGWDTRHFLLQQAAFPVPDRYLALAVNSRYGRTQNQLHLHLACLKPEVYQVISQQKDHLGHQWQRLHTPLSGQQYLAIRVPVTANPFMVLGQYIEAHNDRIDNYGLVRLAPDNNEVILLATRFRLTALSLGSAEALLDFDCHLAQVTG